jgi:hypothetical protein
MNYFNNVSIKKILFGFMILLVQQGMAQCPSGATCYTVETSMDLRKATSFRSKIKHGLKVNKSGSGWTAKMRVESKKEHTWNFGLGCGVQAQNETIFLYGAQVTSNTNGQLVSNPLPGGSIYNRYKPGWFCWSERTSTSNDLYRLKRNAYLLHYKTTENYEIQYPVEGQILTETIRLKVWRAPVKITIELTGNVKITDIQEVVFPGVQPISFSVQPVASSHGCKNSNDKHCQVLHALKEPVKTSNDVFITAHRGLWGDQAESSLGAAKRAYDAGWNIIEVDVNRSKDGQLLLTHDQQLNRTAKKSNGSALNIKDNPGSPNVPTERVWVRDMNYNSITSNMLKSGGGTVNIPKIEDLELYNKWGELVKNTSTMVGSDNKWTRVRRLNDLFDLMVAENWRVLIALDLKERVRAEYLNTVVDVMKLAKDKGVLDHILLKPGASVGEDLPVLTVQEYYEHLSTISHNGETIWNMFANKIAVAPIIQPNWFTPASQGGKGFDFLGYVTPWIALPSFAQFDAIYKNDKADFLYDEAYLIEASSDLGDKTPLQFLKDIGVRPGINWDDATDCRGAGNGRGSWSAPDDRVDASGNLIMGDTRGNLEWLLETEPGMIVTDRPDVVKKYLELFSKNAPLNKN